MSRSIRELFLAILHSLKTARLQTPLTLAVILSNTIIVLSQFLLHYRVSGIVPSILESLVAVEFIVPVVLFEELPLYYYLVGLGLIGFGVLTGLTADHLAYYVVLASSVGVSIVRIEYVVPPLVEKILSVTHPPRTKEEVIISVKSLTIVLLAVLVSALLGLTYTPIAFIVAGYNLVVFTTLFLGVGSKPVKVSPRVSPFFLFTQKYRFLFNRVQLLSRRLSVLYKQAGILGFDLEFYAKYVSLTFLSILVTPTITLLGYIAYGWVGGLLATGLWLVFAGSIELLPKAILSNRAKARASRLDANLLPFMMHIYVVASSGLTIKDIFTLLKHPKGREVLGLEREVAVYESLLRQHRSDLFALRDYVLSLPVSEARDFLYGLLNKIEVLGFNSRDLLMYLEDAIVSTINHIKARIERWQETLKILLEALIMFLVFPVVVLLLVAMFQPGGILAILLLYIIATPLLSFMALSFLSGKVYFKNYIRVNLVPSAVVSTIGVMVAPVLFHEWVKMVTFILLVISASVYLSYRRVAREYAEIENFLPEFIRMLAHYRDIKPLPQALESITQEVSLPPRMKKIVGTLAERIKYESILSLPWLSGNYLWRLTQFLLGVIQVHGGGGTKSVYMNLLRFINEFKNLLYSFKTLLFSYEFVTAVMVPSIFILVITMMLGIAQTLTGLSEQFENMPSMVSLPSSVYNILMFPSIAKQYESLFYAVPLIVTVALNIAVGKVRDGTYYSTRSLVIALLVMLISMYLFPSFMENLLKGTMARSR